MRFPTILFIILIFITSACNLSTASNQSELTAIPTNPANAEPTRTTFPTTDNTSTTKETTSNNDTSTTNTGNSTSATSLTPEQATVICNKQTDWQTYTVGAGDTLFDIAQRSNSSVDTLVSANCLVDAGLISVGQVLYVPAPVQPKRSNDGTMPTIDPNRYTTELWWIIQGDNGATGFAVGCGDSIYLQQSGIPLNLSQNDTINRALAYLTDDTNIGVGQADRGWWNPMSTTDIVMDNYSISGQHVTASLSGDFLLRGVCFDAQLQAQVAINIMHLTGTQSATIYINGQNMAHMFDMSGLNQKDTYTWEEFQNKPPLDTSGIIRYWVESETNGVSDAITVGCESYLAPLLTNSMKSDDTVSDLKIAFDALFDPDRKNPSTVFTNLLKDQNLRAFDISVEDGHAIVNIGPKLLGIGTCADPIIEGQIIQTIFQFEAIQTATVYINGDRNLRQLVDQSGRPEISEYVYTRS